MPNSLSPVAPTPAPRKFPRPDYGLDAPGVVRNLFFFSAAGLFVALAALVNWIPLFLIGPGIGFFISFAITGSWMVYSSKIGKIHAREWLLDCANLRGDENVLDVGCGRGLMLIGAAKRLTTGRATGIDIWQAEDLSGNSAEATLENARREGVANRVEVITGDMRSMPFPSESFDLIVSCWAIHNLYNPADREKAIREISRVMKPGGRAIVKDIRHLGEYTRAFAASGCKDVVRLTSAGSTLVAMLMTFGSLKPGVILVRKAASNEGNDRHVPQPSCAS